MGNGVHYIGVQIAALIIYISLLCCFLGHLKERSLRHLRNYFFSCVLWVGGSLLMRLQVFPGLKFWYYLSLIGLLLLMGSLMDLTTSFLGKYKKGTAVSYYCVVFFLVAVNIFTERILPPPYPHWENNGIYYVYRIDGWFLLGLIPFSVFLLRFVYQLFSVRKHQPKTIKQIRFLTISYAIILLGNFLMLIPHIHFPIDVASSVIAAIFLVLMLYKRHAFMFSERVFIGAIYIVGFVLAFLPLFFISSLLHSLQPLLVQGRASSAIVVYLLMVGVWMMAVFSCSAMLQTRFLNQREFEMQDIIGTFQKKINSSLDISYICSTLLKTTLQLTGLSGAIVDLYSDDSSRDYTMGIGSLVNGKVERNTTPEFLEFVLQQKECFFASDGAHLEEFFKANGLKGWLSDRNFGGIGCLENDRELLGYLFLTKDGPHAITREREQQLSVLCYSAASALRNATLYQKLYTESITDQLTGLYNRKYVQESFQALDSADEPYGILHLDIDNFKLYNELYGTAEGDRLLQWCVELLHNIMPESTKISRYGTDEFIILFTITDLNMIAEFGRRMLRTLANETDLSQKHVHYVTMTGGVSACPLLGKNTEETLHQARQATSMAKTHGRNQIYIYNHASESAKNHTYEDVAPTIYALTAAIDAKDSYTFVHVQKVAEYAVALAKAIGYNRENVEIIRQAALFHDIGKISIPEHILKKTGKLTNEEYAIMKKHVANAIDIIQFLPGMDYVIPAVIGHHERYDGKGYPRGISGENIPESARILAIADSFDAMTAKRAYKEARSTDYAMEELKRCSGSQFDPHLANVFIELLGKGIIKLNNE